MQANSPHLSVSWLRQFSDLEGLAEPALAALVAAVVCFPITAGQVHSPSLGLSVVLQGYLTPVNGLGLGLLPGSLLAPDQSYQVHTDGVIAEVPLADFLLWLDTYGEQTGQASPYLALVIRTVQLRQEQTRQGILLPYRIPKAERGIVGSSRYAQRLRHQIIAAAKHRQPVLIYGEPGLEKDTIAALIHFSGQYRRQPLILVNAQTLGNGADLVGRVGGKAGLLTWLGTGTVILNNIHELPPAVQPILRHLLETGTYRPVTRYETETTAETIPEQVFPGRILLIGERITPCLASLAVDTIKVPPLRVRKADLKALLEYCISIASRERGIPKPTYTPEVLRRLQSYDFPGNTRELRSLVSRALGQSEGVLTEAVFWPDQGKGTRWRWNLLAAYPQWRKLLRSSWWPDRINYGLVLPLYTLTVGLLFWGPQDRHHNVGLTLFWAWWWPLILLSFPLVGRVWCAFCPFMIYGELVQKLSLWLWPRPLGAWPRRQAEQWGGWFLVSLFALIFLWEELWDLPNTAALSAWLLLLITAGAVVCSLLFERRLWCRYLCPIGGMNGLYAKLSWLELRAQQGTCGAECSTYQCYKGGPALGEGQATGGCPVYSHPAQLTDNKDCVLCMTCLKACPHRSITVNLRPPGIDLWTTHTPRPSEVALLLLLLGGIFLHRLPQIQIALHLNWDIHPFGIHLGASLLALGIPALVPYLAHLLSRPSKPFLVMVYGYLPLVLLGTLAHYLPLGLGEGGHILPVTWATLGFEGAGLPSWTGDPAVIRFLQGTSLGAGWLLSILLLGKIGRQGWGHVGGSLLLTWGLWQVMLGS